MRFFLPVRSSGYPATFFLTSLTQFRRQAYDKSVVGVATTSHLVDGVIVNWELRIAKVSGFTIIWKIRRFDHFRQAETRIA